MNANSRPPATTMRVVLEVVIWWGITLGIWLMSLSAMSDQEYLVATLCSLICGLAAAGARWAMQGSWKLRPAWLRPALLVPLAVFTDAAQVLVAPLRRRPRAGRFVTVETGAAGDSPAARTHRALATFWTSITPGTYTLDVDPSTGHMLVHSLAERGPSMRKQVTRS